MKKAICIFCAMLTAGMMIMSQVFAVNEVNSFTEMEKELASPYYVTIYNPRADCIRSGNYINGYIIAYYDSTYTAKMSVTVQRSTDKVDWLKAGSLGTVNGINGKLSLSGDFPAISGYYYRLAATVTVYDGSTVVESLTFYSPVV